MRRGIGADCDPGDRHQPDEKRAATAKRPFILFPHIVACSKTEVCEFQHAFQAFSDAESGFLLAELWTRLPRIRAFFGAAGTTSHA